MSWVSDLGLEHPRMRRHGRRQIPKGEVERYAGGCQSRSGVWRPMHEFDRDLKCYWCDGRKNDKELN